MHIEELSSKKGNKGVTVYLDYDEIKDIANALYDLTSGKQPEKNYEDIAAKCHVLFDLVKHGMVQPHTIKKLKINNGLTVTQNDIEVFRAYVEKEMDPVVFGNTDWNHSYSLIMKCMEEHVKD